jgi:hypothetical protein
VVVVLALGVLLCLAGLALMFNVLGSADFTKRRVTTQPLGTLAPGFAASNRGFRTYAALVLAVGIVALGVGMTSVYVPVGALLIVAGAVIFGITSVIAITGEVETYRALKR